MSTPNPYQNYKQVSIQTAPPEKLILMLYDGTIRFAGQAKHAMKQGDVKQTHQLLNRVHDILTELMSSLNLEQGGEIASNLLQIYDYCNHRLIEANLKRDPSMIEEVIELISEIRDTWNQAIHQLKEGQS